jgi:hypothetical protein
VRSAPTTSSGGLTSRPLSTGGPSLARESRRERSRRGGRRSRRRPSTAPSPARRRPTSSSSPRSLPTSPSRSHPSSVASSSSLRPTRPRCGQLRRAPTSTQRRSSASSTTCFPPVRRYTSATPSDQPYPKSQREWAVAWQNGSHCGSQREETAHAASREAKRRHAARHRATRRDSRGRYTTTNISQTSVPKSHIQLQTLIYCACSRHRHIQILPYAYPGKGPLCIFHPTATADGGVRTRTLFRSAFSCSVSRDAVCVCVARAAPANAQRPMHIIKCPCVPGPARPRIAHQSIHDTDRACDSSMRIGKFAIGASRALSPPFIQQCVP